MTGTPVQAQRLNPLTATGAIWIAAMATGLCMVTVLGRTWFDVDPMAESMRFPGLAPSTRMLLEASVLLAAGLVFLGEEWSGRSANRWALLLWLVPLPIVCWWSRQGGQEFQTAIPWLAAIAGGTALAHACRHGAVRAVVVGVLLALIGPLALRAAVQWGWEIPGTARYFEDNQEALLATMGIEPGSPEALVYQRRVTGGGPTGWFTSSNLLASVLAALSIAWIGMVVAAGRLKRSAFVGGVGAAVATGGVAMVIVTGSLGGAVVLVIGLVLLAAGLLDKRIRRHGGRIAIGLVALAFCVPMLVRAASSVISLEAVPGVRSMLLRWQYDVGAWRMLEAHPWTGVGPAGFQNAYTSVRLPGAVEEVASAHAMAFEWTSTLGILGLAWVAIVLWMVWVAGRRGADIDAAPRAEHAWMAAAGCVAAMIPVFVAMRSEWAVLDDPSRLLRIMGMVLTPVLAVVAVRCMSTVHAGWAVVVAAVMLVVHGQVEMSFAAPATVLFTLALLGTAAPVHHTHGRGVARIGGIAALLAGAAVAWWGVRPMLQQEDLEARASSVLVAGGADPVAARDAATELLVAAWAVQHDPRSLESAIDQQLHAATAVMPDAARAEHHLQRAQRMADELFADARLASTARRSREIAMAMAEVTGMVDDLRMAVDRARRVVIVDPQDPGAYVVLARLLTETGDSDAARTAWTRAIELDDANGVDPLRKLPADVRSEAEAARN